MVTELHCFRDTTRRSSTSGAPNFFRAKDNQTIFSRTGLQGAADKKTNFNQLINGFCAAWYQMLHGPEPGVGGPLLYSFGLTLCPNIETSTSQYRCASDVTVCPHEVKMTSAGQRPRSLCGMDSFDVGLAFTSV